MVNCLVITAIICVLITTVGTIVSFATPNWLSVRVPADKKSLYRVDVCDCSTTDCDCGLWLNCRGGPSSAGTLNNCQWYFANEFAIEKNLPGEKTFLCRTWQKTREIIPDHKLIVYVFECRTVGLIKKIEKWTWCKVVCKLFPLTLNPTNQSSVYFHG